MAEVEETFLSPYRILDLADEQGSLCGKLLADLGADVIKIEPPGGEKTRLHGPFAHDEVSPEKSLDFTFFNMNKRGITLNLDCQDGRDLFRRLAKTADAVIESFSPGYLDGLGLGYEALKLINARLVLTSITPFGQTGPYRDFKSSDLITMAMSGYMQVTGEPDGTPVRLAFNQSYIAASHCGAAGTALSLYAGVGQRIDVSIQEAMALFAADLGIPEVWSSKQDNVVRMGLRSRRAFPFGGFRCKDGWHSLSAGSEPQWDNFGRWVAEVTGERELLDPMYRGPSPATREQYVDYLYPYVEEIFTSKLARQEFFHEGQRRGLVSIPINTVGEMVDDPHLNFRNLFLEAEHPAVGKFKYPRRPYDCPEVPPVLRHSAPLLGQHNEDIYCGELGLLKDDLVALRSAGII